MRSNIETIKFTGRFCLIFAILTYIITLNIEVGFIQLNWTWISNNFALTLCGGALASFLVVMLCEIQKYRSNKLFCENFLYTQAMYLYSMLYFIAQNIGEYISNPKEPIPENLLDERIAMIRNQTMVIRNVDYVTFKKENILTVMHRVFCSEQLAEVDSIVNNGTCLKAAIIQTQINNLEKINSKGVITSADELVVQTLMGLKKQASVILNNISSYLEMIDQSCKGRFNWKAQREKIHENYISLFDIRYFDNSAKSMEK